MSTLARVLTGLRTAWLSAALLAAPAHEAFAEAQKSKKARAKETAEARAKEPGGRAGSDAKAAGGNGNGGSATQEPARASAPASSPDQITLNFKDADIDSVVGAFGHLLQRTFLIDPRVRGKLTLETPRPVGREKAYELLQAALRVQGFAIVESGTLSRVVPEADAKLQSGPVGVGRTTERGGDQIVTQIFRLNYESASNLVPVLRPLISANNTVTAYPSNNSLVITDYAANLQRIARIIASLDSPSTSEVEVVAVKNALASDLALSVSRMLDDTARAAQGAQVDPGQRVVVIPDPRMNTVIVRSASPAKMNLAKSLIARLDQPSNQPGNIHVVYLRNAEAVRLAQVLRGVLSGDSAGGAGGQSGGFGTGGVSQGAAGMSGFGASGAGLQQTGNQSPQSGLGMGTTGGAPGGLPGAPSGAPGMQTPGGGTQSMTFQAGGAIIAADPSTNSLIITAPDPVYRNLRAVIDQLDARRAQVYIESLIVEISSTNAAEIGVQWQFLDGLTGDSSRTFGGTNFSSGGSNILTLTQNPLSADRGLNLGVVKGAITLGGNTIVNLGLLARALESKGNANILATPNLLTLDNEEARIMIGQNVPFITGQFTSTTTAGVNPFQTIERRDVGTALRVRPQVSESGSVRLQIYQESSNIGPNTPQGLITNRRVIESNVLVDDGQIVVLGGLIEDRVEGNVQKVPVIGDVPVVGQLFRYDNRKREKTNLLVFLRPVVMRDANSAHGLTNDRYEYMRQLQGDSRLPQHWALPDYPPAELAPMPVPPGGPASGRPKSLVPEVDASAVRRSAPIVESNPSTVRPGGGDAR